MKRRKFWEDSVFYIFAALSFIVIIYTAVYNIMDDKTVAEEEPVTSVFDSYYFCDNEKMPVNELPEYIKTALSSSDNQNLEHDVHKVITEGERVIYTNYPKAYEITFPEKTKLDFGINKIMTRGVIGDEKIDFTVTKEYSPYDDVPKYIAEYTNRYMMDPRFIEENNITMHKDETKNAGPYRIQFIVFTRNAPENSIHKKNTYAHCYLYTKGRTFFRMTFNTEKYSEEFYNLVYSVAASLNENVNKVGKGGYYLDFKPEIPEYWNEETKKTYENIANREAPAWGIFRPQSVKDNKLEKINAVEEKIGNKFTAALDYMYFGEEVPIEGMKTAYKQGKLVELTMQISTVMHQNLNGYNPFFEVLDGTRDDYIREIAKELKNFKHPFMFRLNNEMNTDWTSYGGACILNEPELFKEVWIHIYEIFEEEGVNNAIWIFNPNDRNCPPNEYNHFVNYYPGNKYVQIYGITGYNTGTYYAEVFGEQWREFETIYDDIYEKCAPYFGKFPWIITEFSSSSVGGDKVQWINNMFDVLPKYENLKIAIWFCSVDYDFRYDIEDNIIARPYLLDETPETAAAFAAGLEKSGYVPDTLFP